LNAIAGLVELVPVVVAVVLGVEAVVSFVVLLFVVDVSQLGEVTQVAVVDIEIMAKWLEERYEADADWEGVACYNIERDLVEAKLSWVDVSRM
jgi:hypothetical protein